MSEEFSKLQDLLKDFIPAISRIVDKIYQDIEGEHEQNARYGIESDSP